MSDKNPDSEAMMAANTDGSYMVRIEDDSGAKEIKLTPEAFAKLITGHLVKGESVG